MNTININVDSPLAQPTPRPTPNVPRYDDNPAPQQGNGAGNGNSAAQATAEPQPPPPSPTPEQEQEFQEAMDQSPPEQEPAPEPWITYETGKVKLRLRKPIQAHGEMVNYLTFKEPTGGDIERIGNPVSMGGGSVNFDSPVMTLMMSHLAAVPLSSIRMMHAVDWNNGAYAIWNFFVPDAFR